MKKLNLFREAAEGKKKIRDYLGIPSDTFSMILKNKKSCKKLMKIPVIELENVPVRAILKKLTSLFYNGLNKLGTITFLQFYFAKMQKNLTKF